MDGVEVRDEAAESRYEAWVDGERAGFAAYILAGELIVFSHTEVDPAFEGRHIGSALVRGALDDVRRRGGLRVMPLCPFVKGWMQRHPEYVELVYAAPPSRVTD